MNVLVQVALKLMQAAVEGKERWARADGRSKISPLCLS
jgi:hypothetical protein